MDQGVCPGLIITTDSGYMLICSGCSMLIGEDTIVVTFAPIEIFNITVTCTLDRGYPGINAVAIPNSEWWLTASTHNNT